MHAELGVAPTWCFNRFGQSSTTLPDGRIVFIGGEHEDYYDPDFYIYNDVVAVAPDGETSIYGYPNASFPPTDFHSATLLGDEICVIGNLGRPNARRAYLDTVFLLDLNSFSFRPQKTNGECPKWTHGHDARLLGEVIRISGGNVGGVDEQPIVENWSTWELSLETLRWKHVYRHQWRRWELRRADSQINLLWEIRRALFSKKQRWTEDIRSEMSHLVAKIGREPRLESIEDLYRSAIPHRFIGEDEESYGTHRIIVDGVTVRYVEQMHAVQLTIEGLLPDDIQEELVRELKGKLSELEAIEYVAVEIP